MVNSACTFPASCHCEQPGRASGTSLKGKERQRPKTAKEKKDGAPQRAPGPGPTREGPQGGKEGEEDSNAVQVGQTFFSSLDTRGRWENPSQIFAEVTGSLECQGEPVAFTTPLLCEASGRLARDTVGWVISPALPSISN